MTRERGRSASHDPVETLLKTAQANVNLSAELLQQIKQARLSAYRECREIAAGLPRKHGGTGEISVGDQIAAAIDKLIEGGK